MLCIGVKKVNLHSKARLKEAKGKTSSRPEGLGLAAHFGPRLRRPQAQPLSVPRVNFRIKPLSRNYVVRKVRVPA